MKSRWLSDVFEWFGGVGEKEEESPDTLRSSRHPATGVPLPPATEFLIDERVERLLKEQKDLLHERACLREVAQDRWDRASELLEVARAGRRMTKEYFEAHRAFWCGPPPCNDARARLEVAADALEAWAAEVL